MTISSDNMVLAAEYVLGTLAADELDEAERLIEHDAEFAAAVRQWERQLGELSALVGSVEPPADTLDKIKARLGDAMQPVTIRLPDVDAPRFAAPQLDIRSARPVPPGTISAADAVTAAAADGQRGEVVVMQRRVRSAQRVSGLLALVAASALALYVTSAVRPELLPEQLRPKPQTVEVVRTVEKPAASPGRFTAVLQRDSISPAFILTVDLEARTMTVRRVAAEQMPDKSYELWLVSNRFAAPRSLGLVGDREFTPAQLASFEAGTISDAVYAISLEPTGGSPTGQPTGPVLWTGKLVETLPPAGNR